MDSKNCSSQQIELLQSFVSDFACLVQDSQLLAKTAEEYFQGIGPAKLDRRQMREMIGIGINLLLIAARKLCPVDAATESLRSPRDRVAEILFYNKLVADLREDIPIANNPFTDVVFSDCMDARLNTRGLDWADPTHRVDSLKDAGGVLSSHMLESFAGSIALHNISVGFICQHTTCGLKTLAAKRYDPEHIHCREAVEGARYHASRIHWVLEQQKVAERLRDGKLWVVVAEIDTSTKRLQHVYRADSVGGGEVQYVPLSVDNGLELIEGEPQAEPPTFMQMNLG